MKVRTNPHFAIHLLVNIPFYEERAHRASTSPSFAILLQLQAPAEGASSLSRDQPMNSKVYFNFRITLPLTSPHGVPRHQGVPTRKEKVTQGSLRANPARKAGLQSAQALRRLEVFYTTHYIHTHTSHNAQNTHRAVCRSNHSKARVSFLRKSAIQHLITKQH